MREECAGVVGEGGVYSLINTAEHTTAFKKAA